MSKMQKATRRQSFPPRYWWDYDGESIIVESDSPKYPIVARFPSTDSIIVAVKQAEDLINNLTAGRVTPKAVR